MTLPHDILLTGFASVSASGPRRGLPALEGPAEPRLIERWSSAGPRRAFLVPPFRPADVVPGLKTRRMDRLSAWALLGSTLALQDACLDAETLDRDRTAIVAGTAFGCLDLTEEFLGALATNASQAPPILFPETLANLPASHIARHFGIRGPNLTLCAGPVSGEAALLQAVSLLQAGEADRALVLAGDTLTRALFEWYEAASLLAPVCLGGTGSARPGGRRTIVPGEGLAACLLERRDVASERRARAHGRYHAGWIGSLPRDARGEAGFTPVEQHGWRGTLGPEGEARGGAGFTPAEPRGGGGGVRRSTPPLDDFVQRLLRQMLADAAPQEVVLVAPAASGPCWMTSLERPAGLRSLPGLEFGEFGGSGLLQLGVALARLPELEHGFAVVAGPAHQHAQVAAILVARPEAW